MIINIDDEEFGTVAIATRANQRTVHVAWHNGMPRISIPPDWMTDDPKSLHELVDIGRKCIRRMAPKRQLLHFNQTIPFFHGSFFLAAQHDSPNIHIHNGSDNIVLGIPADVDISRLHYQRLLSTVMSECLEPKLKEHVFPLAWHYADKFHLSPKKFVVGHGLRKMGHCTRGGTIQLSRNIMFLPQQVIVYLICHELAHLTHFNHSKDFHDLCNTYLNGKEKELSKQLDEFIWPIVS